jgi:hypothetical protein
MPGGREVVVKAKFLNFLITGKAPWRGSKWPLALLIKELF